MQRKEKRVDWSFAVLAGYATYALISQLWVKLTILVGMILFVARL